MITFQNHTFETRQQAVMTVAHWVRINAAKRWDCKASEIVWSECVKIAWEGIKKGAKVVVEKTIFDKLSDLDGCTELSRWEEGFVLDNIGRVSCYGEKTIFSAKQESIINRMYEEYCR